MPSVPTLNLTVAVIAEICETWLFGLYSALFIYSIYILLVARTTSQPNLILTITTVIMFLVSSSHWAVQTAVIVGSTRRPYLLTVAERVAVLAIPRINYVLGDAVVLWRAWVICDRATIPFILPLIGILATIATSIAAPIYDYRCFAAFSARNANADLALGAIMWTTSLFTNLYTTAFIAIRAWKYRRFIKRQMGKSSRKTRAEGVLSLLLESGALYLALWIAVAVLTFSAPGVTPIFTAVTAQFVGIYPTIIIVVVELRKTFADVIYAFPTMEDSVAAPNPADVIHEAVPAEQTIILIERSVMQLGNSFQSANLSSTQTDTESIPASHQSADHSDPNILTISTAPISVGVK